MDKVMELYIRSMVAISQPRKGQGLVEYALIIVLVSIVVVSALGLLGDEITTVFENITDELAGA